MTDIRIEGGRALFGGEILEASFAIEDGLIRDIGGKGQRGARGELDASGLLVLPSASSTCMAMPSSGR